MTTTLESFANATSGLTKPKTIKTVDVGPDGKPRIREATAEESAAHLRTLEMKAKGAQPQNPVAAEASLSFARARMEARRKAKADAGFKSIVPVKVEGEEWYIKHLSASETLALPFYIARRDGGVMELTELDPKNNDDDRHALYIAIIYACTVAGADDIAPAFASIGEVWEQFDEPGEDQFVLALIAKVLTVNPKLIKNLTGG